MITTEKTKGRGRPRTFDTEAALDIAQGLFHAQGYDAVGIAALTQSLGINPPSFYAAFGSKAALFARVLERYAAAALPVDTILIAGRAPTEALGELLAVAAHVYSSDPAAPGCLALEAARAGGDPESAARAATYVAASRTYVHDYMTASHPEQADMIADYVIATMSGLSASARHGWSRERLTAIAALASRGISNLLAGS